jgi:hypothetical protein
MGADRESSSTMTRPTCSRALDPWGRQRSFAGVDTLRRAATLEFCGRVVPADGTYLPAHRNRGGLALPTARPRSRRNDDLRHGDARCERYYGERVARPVRHQGVPAALFGQSREFIENVRNQLLAARVPSVGGASEELNEISRLLCRLDQSFGRSSDEKFLKLLLTLLQGRLVSLDLVEPASNLRILLGMHAAVLVEFYGLVRHGR